MSKVVKKLYATPKQQKFLRSRAKRKTFHGGRGSGKSTTAGYVVGQIFETCPRATFLFGGLTYVQLDLIVMPAIREALGFMGYFEYNPKVNPFGVYVVGIRPPDNWIKPYKQVGKLGYQYCISFINGATIRFVSQDNPETHRGISSDGLLIDESATIKEEFVNKVLWPTVRANARTTLANQPLHHCFFDFSSASWTPQGMWIYKNEELYKEEQEKRAKFTEQELKDKPPRHLFIESNFRDNEALPSDYGENLRQLLDPLEYDVEVENVRVGKKPTSFYHQFEPVKHTYFKSYDYQADDRTGIFTYKSNDYVLEAPLEISFDFNAGIVWIIVCQEVGNEARVINSKYFKPNNKPESLVVQAIDWFLDTYSGHSRKVVNIYGDPGGKQRSASTSSDNKPFFDQIKDKLKGAKWRFVDKVLKGYPRHKEKYRLVNYILEEANTRGPRLRINSNTNKVLIIAVQNAEIEPHSQTFEKNKKAETEKDQRRREYATDGTDALDYWLWPKYNRLLAIGGGSKMTTYSR